MAFNLLPSKWLNKRNGITVRREDGQQEQEHPVYSLQREMNRVFDDFFHAWETPLLGRSFDLSPFSTFEQSAATPRIDVHETDKELRISAELPGMTEKDIDVSLSKDMLTISGEKKQETEENVKGWYRMERTYGSFTRSIPLPCEVDQDRCQASFKNGVLTVSLSKTPQAQATMKSIPIKKE
jgi:HSP20 family protein